MDGPFRDTGSETVTGGRFWTGHFGILDLKLCHKREVSDKLFRDTGSETVTGRKYWTRNFGILDLKLSQEGRIGRAISKLWIKNCH